MQLDENGVPFYRSMRKTEENTPQTTEGDIAPEKPAVQRSGQTESRIGEMYPEDGSLSESGNNQGLNRMAYAMGLADIFVRMQYLSGLEDAQILPASAWETGDSPAGRVRLFHITELTYDGQENILDKLGAIFGAISRFDATAVYILRHDGYRAEVYMGTACENQGELGMIFQTLKKFMKGNFPGCRTRQLRVRENEKLLKEIFDPPQLAVASVSATASVRNGGGVYLQGLEKLVDAMRENPFSLVVLASAASIHTITAMRAGLESLYTQLTPFHRPQQTVSRSESVGITNTIGETISRSVTLTTGTSASHTDTSGTSQSRNISRENDQGYHKKEVAVQLAAIGGMAMAGGLAGGLAGALGSVPGGALAGNSFLKMMGIKAENESEGSSAHEDSSDTRGTSESRAEGDTRGTSESRAQNVGVGNTRGVQYAFENKAVSEILEAIEQRLARLRSCGGGGAFQCAAYVLAADQATARMGASMYASLLKGDMEASDITYLNVWQDPDKVRLLTGYLTRMMHPVFCLPDQMERIPRVTAAVLATSGELPVYFAWPRKPVPGLDVETHAEFARDIPGRKISGMSIPVGYLTHMGSVEDVRISMSLEELTRHMFVAGTTGSGKSNFCYVLLDGLMKSGVNVLAVEPAKGEYASVFGGRKDVRVFGTNDWFGPMLTINPFAFPAGIHVLEHLERLIQVFNASWPMYAAMPEVLKEAVARAYEACGWDLDTGECVCDPPVFPTFVQVTRTLPEVLDETAYSQEVKGNYMGALLTRVKSMTQYSYKKIFCQEEIPDQELFDTNVLIDISRLGSSETKALIMGILVIRLQEYRSVQKGGMNRKLRHVTLLEEAHHLLRGVSAAPAADGGNLRGMSVEILTNAIAEMRTYGEGFVIADQSPKVMDETVIRNTGTKVIFRLPQEEDRRCVGRAMALREEQILEIARLKTGIAVIHQGHWESAVLCRTDYFDPSVYRPFIWQRKTKEELEEMRTLRGSLFALVLSGRMGIPIQTDAEEWKRIMKRARALLGQNPEDRELLKAGEAYETADVLECWDNFGELGRIIGESFPAGAFYPEDMPSVWDERNRRKLAGRAQLSEDMKDQLLGIILIRQAAKNPGAHRNFFRWYAWNRNRRKKENREEVKA